MQTETHVYTDGSCLGNPGGPGGWAFAILTPESVWCVSGGDSATTNNRMELQAVIETLIFSDTPNIVVHTDSKWVENCATGKWQKKANCDLWKQYESLSSDRSIRFVWVKGHSGNAYNNLVDGLARSEAKKYKTF